LLPIQTKVVKVDQTKIAEARDELFVARCANRRTGGVNRDLPPELIQDIASWSERFPRFIDELVRIGRFTPSDYMRSLSEVVLTLGRHGGSVVVGRGAFLILDPSSTLRVRCRAPLDWRVAQMAKRRNMSAADARSMVLRIDAERVDFYRDNFKVDVSEPEHFDLVLDTSRGAAEKASVDAIIDAFEARFGAPKSEFRRRRPPAEVVARLG